MSLRDSVRHLCLLTTPWYLVWLAEGCVPGVVLRFWNVIATQLGCRMSLVFVIESDLRSFPFYTSPQRLLASPESRTRSTNPQGHVEAGVGSPKESPIPGVLRHLQLLTVQDEYRFRFLPGIQPYRMTMYVIH